MLGSQPITPMFFQVVAYSPLDDEYDAHKVREFYSPIDDTSYPLIKDVLDDASSCDEDIYRMETFLIN